MTSRQILKMFALGLALLSSVFSSSYAQGDGVKTQLIIIMDGSSSIASEDFRTMIEAVASSLSDPNVVPQNGTVEVALVQFSHLLRDAKTGIPGATTELVLTVVDPTTVGEIARRIRNVVQAGGFTPMSQGIRVATELIKAKPRPGARQVYNIISDGNPNLPGGPDQAQEEAIKARNEAVTAGLDQLDAEAIGDAVEERGFIEFMQRLVYPQPGFIVDNSNFPVGTKNGFVVVVRRFQDLERAFRQKLVFTLNQPPVVDAGPTPDGTPDAQPYTCNVGQAITLDGSGSFDPDAAPNAPNKGIAKFEWDFNGDGTPDATGPRVQFTCPSTPGTVTIRLTVTDG
ncbi:MAG: VWA domain-containing protein, partial [Candidatus Bipolaricaulota bacterium]|nr:VWA domain-containing protein [Candidatus Bipolaricaulota bacterium]